MLSLLLHSVKSIFFHFPLFSTPHFSGSDSGNTVTTTPSSRVKTPVPAAASVSSPSPPPLLVQPPPQQQQLQAVLTAASTPQAPQLFQTASSNNNVSFRKVMTIPDSLKCDVLGCERSFRTVQEYTAHRQWLHEPVQCPLCKMFFAGERSLKAHMKAHEGPNGLYKCHLCPGTFRDKATLQAHVDVFHTEYTCLECGSVFQGSEQVWPLTQLYSIDFSQSRIGVNKCVFYKRTIKVCISCC